MNRSTGRYISDVFPNLREQGGGRSFKNLPLYGQAKQIYGEKGVSPHLSGVFRSGSFYTWVEEDMEEYNKLMQECVLHRSELMDEWKQIVPRYGWIIFVRWVDMIYLSPETAERIIPDRR